MLLSASAGVWIVGVGGSVLACAACREAEDRRAHNALQIREQFFHRWGHSRRVPVTNVVMSPGSARTNKHGLHGALQVKAYG